MEDQREFERELIDWIRKNYTENGDGFYPEFVLPGLVMILAGIMATELHADKQTMLFLAKRFMLDYRDAKLLFK